MKIISIVLKMKVDRNEGRQIKKNNGVEILSLETKMPIYVHKLLSCLSTIKVK
uniref:Uncharacterized protein n=1 Tax=Daucus carota subsp. sativus TaxID=79200 RepID=A0A166GYY2_DAUCS